MVRSFLNKFDEKICKRFPPHLNDVSIYTTLWNLKSSLRRCYDCIVRERNSRICPISTVASKFAWFAYSWLQRVGIRQEKVYKTRITDLDELKQWLRTEWTKLDHIIIQPYVNLLSNVHVSFWSSLPGILGHPPPVLPCIITVVHVHHHILPCQQ